MNADLEEMVANDAEMRHFVESLRRVPCAHVAKGFSARVMAEVQAQRRRSVFSVSTAFAAAASLVALLAVGSIFFRPVPRQSYAGWVQMPRTVRLAPYNPADWYAPLACDVSTARLDDEPLCTREALAYLAH